MCQLSKKKSNKRYGTLHPQILHSDRETPEVLWKESNWYLVMKSISKLLKLVPKCYYLFSVCSIIFKNSGLSVHLYVVHAYI